MQLLKWRNGRRRRLKISCPMGVRVRVPLSAPQFRLGRDGFSFFKSHRTHGISSGRRHLFISYALCSHGCKQPLPWTISMRNEHVAQDGQRKGYHEKASVVNYSTSCIGPAGGARRMHGHAAEPHFRTIPKHCRIAPGRPDLLPVSLRPGQGEAESRKRLYCHSCVRRCAVLLVSQFRN